MPSKKPFRRATAALRSILGIKRSSGLSDLEEEKLRLIVSLLNDRSQPNINALNIIIRNLDILALNVKAMGYDLATQLAAALPVAAPTKARRVRLGSKLSTQHDLESDWLAHWCAELRLPVIYHRKLWEFAYLFQMLHNRGSLRAGTRGLGFGCGVEPIASYFAARGIATTITDLAPEDSRSLGWSSTNQNAASLESAWHPNLVDRERYFDHVSHRVVDMTAIPADLVDYDFCWSVCALEHLGSIAAGLDFIENAMATLRPGGIAIHTTEFNINPDGPTIDNWDPVLFQQKHFEELAARLEARGHRVAKFDFDPGAQPLDRFIDLPPWHDGTMGRIVEGFGQPSHLKVAIDGFVSTCIGIAVTKAR